MDLEDPPPAGPSVILRLARLWPGYDSSDIGIDAGFTGGLFLLLGMPLGAPFGFFSLALLAGALALPLRDRGTAIGSQSHLRIRALADARYVQSSEHESYHGETEKANASG